MPEPHTAESDLLQQCPWCEYALTGLPIEHGCPKCGHAFDRRWRVFFNRPRVALMGRTRCLLHIVCCLTIVFIIVDLVQLPVLSAENFVLLPAILIPVSLLRLIRSKPPQFVGVGPAGVVLVTRRTGAQQIFPWHRVGKAELDVKDRPVLLLDAERVTLTTLGGREPEECVDFINRCRDDLGLE